MTEDGDSGSQNELFYHYEETGTFTLPILRDRAGWGEKVKWDYPSRPQAPGGERPYSGSLLVFMKSVWLPHLPSTLSPSPWFLSKEWCHPQHKGLLLCLT